MKISKGRWDYPLYALVSPAPHIPQTRWTYACRASLNTFGLLGLLVCAAALTVISSIVTIATNLVTIPLGFGIAVTFFGKDFLQVPFRVRQGGKNRSLVHFLAPFWAGVAAVTSVWLGLSAHPTITTAVLTCVTLTLVAFRAKKESLHELIEFVED